MHFLNGALIFHGVYFKISVLLASELDINLIKSVVLKISMPTDNLSQDYPSLLIQKAIQKAMQSAVTFKL